jgi:hypothetical protein
MAISSEQQKKLQNEQPGANDLNELKEKENRQKQADLQVSGSLGMSEPGKRDGGGNLLLFPDQTAVGLNKNVESKDQYILTKLNQSIYDQDSINEVIDNVVEELLPTQATEEEAMSLREEIIAFFKEYEFLRDNIWDLNGIEELQSHKYLVEQSKTYLPVNRIPYKYDGDTVGTKGQAKLLDNNIIQVREAAMLSNMVGYTLQVYGVTSKKNPIITVEEFLDSVKQTILKEDTGEFRVRLFVAKLRRALNAKFETGQIRRKEDYDECQKYLKEIFDEVGYPEVDDEQKEEKPKPKTVAEKAKRKDKKKRRQKRRIGKRRFGRNSRFMGGRRRVKIKVGKTRNSNRRRTRR